MSLKKRTERVNFEVLLKSIKKKQRGLRYMYEILSSEAIEDSLGIAHKISINKCVNCTQCLINCQFGAIEQMSFVDEILKHLDDPKSFAVVHPSPAIRVSIAEEFERNPGDFTINKLYSAFEKAEIFRGKDIKNFLKQKITIL